MKLGFHQLPGPVQDEEDVLRPLEDLQEKIFRYQVRSRLGVLPRR